MSAKRDLSLIPRKENQRDAQPIAPPVQFSLEEIQQHFVDSMQSIKEQYVVADSLLVDGNENGCKTIWRSQIVLAEGLLDFYIHEMSKFCLFRMFTGQWEKSEKYASIKIPMAKVEEAMEAIESKDWFFNYLNDRFSRDVFISKESMRDQLNLIGIGFSAVMVKAFPSDKEETSNKYGSKVVADLFERRNVIAHQNDISKEFVSDYISKVETIMSSIHSIAEDKG